MSYRELAPKPLEPVERHVLTHDRSWPAYLALGAVCVVGTYVTFGTVDFVCGRSVPGGPAECIGATTGVDAQRLRSFPLTPGAIRLGSVRGNKGKTRPALTSPGGTLFGAAIDNAYVLGVIDGAEAFRQSPNELELRAKKTAWELPLGILAFFLVVGSSMAWQRRSRTVFIDPNTRLVGVEGGQSWRFEDVQDVFPVPMKKSDIVTLNLRVNGKARELVTGNAETVARAREAIGRALTASQT